MLPGKTPPCDLQERAPEAALALQPIFGGRRQPDEYELRLPEGEWDGSPVVRESPRAAPAWLVATTGWFVF
jgi:hypothetical protein